MQLHGIVGKWEGKVGFHLAPTKESSLVLVMPTLHSRLHRVTYDACVLDRICSEAEILVLPPLQNPVKASGDCTICDTCNNKLQLVSRARHIHRIRALAITILFDCMPGVT